VALLSMHSRGDPEIGACRCKVSFWQDASSDPSLHVYCCSLFLHETSGLATLCAGLQRGHGLMNRLNHIPPLDQENGFPPNPNRIFPHHFGTFCIFLGSGVVMKLRSGEMRKDTRMWKAQIGTLQWGRQYFQRKK
jgi:hypothetical protein